jgi:hypothetical protein
MDRKMHARTGSTSDTHPPLELEETVHRRRYVKAEYVPCSLRMKMVRNGPKISQPFFTFTFEYENKSENDKVRHETNANLRNIENFENEPI